MQATEGNISIKFNDENVDDILIKFQELMKINIIGQDFYNQFTSKFVTYRIWYYDNQDIKYKVVKIFTQDSLEEAVASIEIENKTDKIIAYTVKKEYSSVSQDILLKYVKYLELDTAFDDWEYRDNELKSKAAGIKIIGNTDNKYNYIKVVPFEY